MRHLCDWYIDGWNQCGRDAPYKKGGRYFCKIHAIQLDKEYQAGTKSILGEPSLDLNLKHILIEELQTHYPTLTTTDIIVAALEELLANAHSEIKDKNK